MTRRDISGKFAAAGYSGGGPESDQSKNLRGGSGRHEPGRQGVKVSCLDRTTLFSPKFRPRSGFGLPPDSTLV